MNSLKTLLFALTIVTIPVAANANSTLYDAACEYRDAVRHFERAVNDVRIVDRYDIKLVNRLEDAACDLRSRARHPEQVDRLTYAWQEVQSLHRRVESAILGRTCYRSHPVLVECWERVNCAYRDLEIQMRGTCSPYHAHRPSAYGPVHRAPVEHHPYGPRVLIPQANTPQVLPPQFRAPTISVPRTTVPYGTPNHFDRRVTPGLNPPAIDEIRYRQWDRSPTHDYRVQNRYYGQDIRSAVVGAMLSRLLD